MQKIGEALMDSYIIRIYRRDGNNPTNIAGLVEIVESDEKRPFANYEELLRILNIFPGQADSQCRPEKRRT